MNCRIAIATGLLLAAGSLQAQTSNGRSFVAVHGQARQEVVPDLFPLQVTLRETSTDAAATQARIEGLAATILATGKGLKIDGADIDVSNLSISPEYRYDRDAEKQVFLGNTYAREIKIRFHALQDMKAFLGSLPKSDAIQVDTQPFESSRAAELRQALLRQAVANARETAETMASSVGTRLGPVINISNQGLNLEYSETMDRIQVTGNRVAGAPPAEPILDEGKITLDQDVYIVYSLE